MMYSGKGSSSGHLMGIHHIIKERGSTEDEGMRKMVKRQYLRGFKDRELPI